MLTSSEFVKSKLFDLYHKAKGVKIRYEHKKNIYTHIIEVLPIELYRDEEYMTLEIDLIDEFNKLFPKEEILFISENSLNKITQPLLKIGYESELHYSGLSNVLNWRGLNLISVSADNTSYALAA